MISNNVGNKNSDLSKLLLLVGTKGNGHNSIRDLWLSELQYIPQTSKDPIFIALIEQRRGSHTEIWARGGTILINKI